VPTISFFLETTLLPSADRVRRCDPSLSHAATLARGYPQGASQSIPRRDSQTYRGSGFCQGGFVIDLAPRLAHVGTGGITRGFAIGSAPRFCRTPSIITIVSGSHPVPKSSVGRFRAGTGGRWGRSVAGCINTRPACSRG